MSMCCVIIRRLVKIKMYDDVLCGKSELVKMRCEVNSMLIKILRYCMSMCCVIGPQR